VVRRREPGVRIDITPTSSLNVIAFLAGALRWLTDGRRTGRGGGAGDAREGVGDGVGARRLLSRHASPTLHYQLNSLHILTPCSRLATLLYVKQLGEFIHGQSGEALQRSCGGSGVKAAPAALLSLCCTRTSCIFTFFTYL